MQKCIVMKFLMWLDYAYICKLCTKYKSEITKHFVKLKSWGYIWPVTVKKTVIVDIKSLSTSKKYNSIL